MIPTLCANSATVGLPMAHRVWRQVQHADRWDAAADQVGGSLALGDYVQRCHDRAHRRYLHAIRTLAQVRRLLGPSVQVNIAEKQLNLAQLG